jgi:CspA family cold shock protein
MLIARKKIQLSQGMIERMEEELELHGNGEDLRLLSMKDLSQFLPSCEEQTTVLLSMSRLIPWGVIQGTVKWFDTEKEYGFIEQEDGGDIFVSKTEVEGTITGGDAVEFKAGKNWKGLIALNVRKVLKEKKKETEVDEYRQEPLRFYKARFHDREDPRLMRTIEVIERNFIVPRLELQRDIPPSDYPYLVCFRGGGFAVDTEPVANVVSLRFSKGLLYWMIGREGRTRGSCVYRQPNTDFAEAYRDFMRIDNRRFQPLSVFEDIVEKLADLRATGKVAVYLKRGTINSKSQAQRVLLVPETDWQNRDFTDLTYDIRHQDIPGTTGGEIEQVFSSIYSVIPGAPEDAHLNRWYAVDFVLGSNDNSGERYLFPDHETIEPLCQLCAAETIEIEGDPKQNFICKGCSEWYHKKPNTEEE